MSKTYLKADHFNGGGSLEQEITGVRAALPLPAIVASGIDLKAFEDALDAVICAWVAISALEDWAKPYGDENSAIWVPSGALNPRRTTPVLMSLSHLDCTGRQG